MEKKLSKFELEQQKEIERRVTYLEEHVDMKTNSFSKINWIFAIIVIISSFILVVSGSYM